MGRTLVICKPDAVERGMLGQILGRLEAKGLRLVAGELRMLDENIARAHYAEHAGKSFLDDLISFITRSVSFVAVVESEGETWSMVRSLMGATDPAKAAPGTIRGDFAVSMSENLIHGSDSELSAEREISLFFPNLA